jgi:hypothetical protein
MTETPYPIVKIKWYDACGAPTHAKEVDIEKLKEVSPLTKYTVGWEIANTKDKVILVFDVSEEGDRHNYTKDWILIPKKYILERKVIQK